MHVISLPKAVTWKWIGRDSNPRPLGSRVNALPLRHTKANHPNHGVGRKRSVEPSGQHGYIAQK